MIVPGTRSSVSFWLSTAPRISGETLKFIFACQHQTGSLDEQVFLLEILNLDLKDFKIYIKLKILSLKHNINREI